MSHARPLSSSLPLRLPSFPLALLLFLLDTLPLALGSKRGLAWPNSNWVPMTGFQSPNSTITSYYTWSPNPILSTTSSLSSSPFPFIPMLWGCNATYTSPFMTALNASFSHANLTTDKVVLAFNEPEQAGQSNCTPAQAAQNWKSYLEPLKEKGYRLGSPGVTSGTQGEEWLLDWYSECAGGCNPDFIALHWYDMSTENLISTMQSFHTTFNLPIWITDSATPSTTDLSFPSLVATEMAVQNFTTVNTSSSVFGVQATLPEITNIMNATMAWLDGTSWVERYFWFGAMYEMQGVNPLDSLFLASGESKRTGALNSLGVLYAGSNGTLTSGTTGGNGGGGSHGQSSAGSARWTWGSVIGMILGLAISIINAS